MAFSKDNAAYFARKRWQATSVPDRSRALQHVRSFPRGRKGRLSPVYIGITRELKALKQDVAMLKALLTVRPNNGGFSPREM